MSRAAEFLPGDVNDASALDLAELVELGLCPVAARIVQSVGDVFLGVLDGVRQGLGIELGEIDGGLGEDRCRGST